MYMIMHTYHHAAGRKGPCVRTQLFYLYVCVIRMYTYYQTGGTSNRVPGTWYLEPDTLVRSVDG